MNYDIIRLLHASRDILVNGSPAQQKDLSDLIGEALAIYASKREGFMGLSLQPDDDHVLVPYVPTNSMLVAGNNVITNSPIPEVSGVVWRAMIQAWRRKR